MSKNPEQLTGEALYTSIRALYPNPVTISFGAGLEDSYCVGGALALTVGKTVHFPTLGELAKILQEANPNLTYSEAIANADYIMTLNDNRQMDNAWHMLKTALTYQGETE